MTQTSPDTSYFSLLKATHQKLSEHCRHAARVIMPCVIALLVLGAVEHQPDLMLMLFKAGLILMIAAQVVVIGIFAYTHNDSLEELERLMSEKTFGPADSSSELQTFTAIVLAPTRTNPEDDSLETHSPAMQTVLAKLTQDAQRQRADGRFELPFDHADAALRRIITDPHFGSELQEAAAQLHGNLMKLIESCKPKR